MTTAYNHRKFEMKKSESLKPIMPNTSLYVNSRFACSHLSSRLSSFILANRWC